MQSCHQWMFLDCHCKLVRSLRRRYEYIIVISLLSLSPLGLFDSQTIIDSLKQLVSIDIDLILTAPLGVFNGR
jgi:hypothetical protein